MIAQLSGDYLRFRPQRALPRLISYGLFEGRPLLTRGRWINPLVGAALGLWTRLPLLGNVEQPVFIVGTGRSGTTVIGLLLSLHADIGFLNEPKAVWHAIHPGEDLIGSYTGGPVSYRMNALDATQAARDAARHIYGAYARVTASTRIVDKYPELIFRTEFVRALFPDARFIVIVRNGWDACRSVATWSCGHQHTDTGVNWWGRNGRKWRALVEQVASTDADLAPHVSALSQLEQDEDRAAVEWLLSMREVPLLARRYPGDVLEVRYERLTSAALDEMQAILEFCRVRDDPALRRHAARILTPTPPGPPLTLHPLIAVPFRNTMTSLGYA